jgi:two-component system, sensor histidine kinase and response regulator
METTEKKILLADDSSVNNLLLQDILEESGYQVIVAESGKKALKLLPKEKPDLILLDIMMPVMDGFQVLEKIKSEEELKFIPVIMVTAKSTQFDKKRAIELGAADYIIKPIDVEDTIERIQRALK